MDGLLWSLWEQSFVPHGLLGQADPEVNPILIGAALAVSASPLIVGGLLAIVAGATTVFAQMQKSLNQIWDVVPRPSRSGVWRLIKARLLSLTVVLAIGFVLLVSLLVSVALRAAMAFAEQWLPLPGWVMVGFEIVLSLTVITGLFAAIFKILPDVMLRWRDVLAGALTYVLIVRLIARAKFEQMLDLVWLVFPKLRVRKV